MTTADDSEIQSFLTARARHAVAGAPTLDQAVGRLAPRVSGRPSHASRRLIVLLAATLLLVAALTSALAVGSGLLRLPILIDEPDVEPMLNGSILHADADDMYWLESTAPPPPGGDRTYHWDAFDQDAGSFLYAVEGHLWVVDQNGLVAEVRCPASSDCTLTGMDTFGPDFDEITVPSRDRRSIHVLGFDGTLREMLDISAAALAPGQVLTDLAWSPDGGRLAVSTEPALSDEPEPECNDADGPCGGNVWLFDRDGSEPQILYTERAANYSVLQDLAWSPDGDTLALIAGPTSLCGGPDRPQLVALRLTQKSVLPETLHVYHDEDGVPTCTLSRHFDLAFPFAWSPDGTRIAVTTGGAVAEISAEDGEVLVVHPDQGAEGPLAWLQDRSPQR